MIPSTVFLKKIKYKPFPENFRKGFESRLQNIEILEKDGNVLTVAIGYADGYPRCLSGRGTVYVRGRPLRVIGRVCMDNVMLDGGDGFFEAGDKAEIFGFDTPQSTDDFARSCDTVSYEALCRISGRVRRIFVYGGSVVDIR